MDPKIKKLKAARDAELLAPVFETYPDVKNVTWTQYTPSFNDGDPCTFRSGHTYPGLNTDEDGEEGDAPDGAYGAVKKALSVFDDDDMYAFFGNGTRVTVTRKGVKVEDYDCGY